MFSGRLGRFSKRLMSLICCCVDRTFRRFPLAPFAPAPPLAAAPALAAGARCCCCCCCCAGLAAGVAGLVGLAAFALPAPSGASDSALRLLPELAAAASSSPSPAPPAPAAFSAFFLACFLTRVWICGGGRQNVARQRGAVGSTHARGRAAGWARVCIVGGGAEAASAASAVNARPYACVCACVCACVRVRVRVRVCACACARGQPAPRLASQPAASDTHLFRVGLPPQFLGEKLDRLLLGLARRLPHGWLRARDPRLDGVQQLVDKKSATVRCENGCCQTRLEDGTSGWVDQRKDKETTARAVGIVTTPAGGWWVLRGENGWRRPQQHVAVRSGTDLL